MGWLIDFLRDSSTNNIDINGADRLKVHSKILSRKPLLRKVLAEFHNILQRLDEIYLNGNGLRIELGAGIAPMRESFPDVLATDVIDAPNLDKIFDAESVDLIDKSVRVFFAQNCFHHFPHSDMFFEELDKVLAPGGGLILVEPYYGSFASVLYKRLFSTEGFDKSYPSWETPVSGPMNGANQALSYIVFKRDRADFDRMYPNLKIIHQECVNNYLKYLLSGGLNFKQLCPDFLSSIIGFVQWCLMSFNHLFLLHHVIIIRKVQR